MYLFWAKLSFSKDLLFRHPQSSLRTSLDARISDCASILDAWISLEHSKRPVSTYTCMMWAFIPKDPESPINQHLEKGSKCSLFKLDESKELILVSCDWLAMDVAGWIQRKTGGSWSRRIPLTTDSARVFRDSYTLKSVFEVSLVVRESQAASTLFFNVLISLQTCAERE